MELLDIRGINQQHIRWPCVGVHRRQVTADNVQLLRLYSFRQKSNRLMPPKRLETWALLWGNWCQSIWCLQFLLFGANWAIRPKNSMVVFRHTKTKCKLLWFKSKRISRFCFSMSLLLLYINITSTSSSIIVKPSSGWKLKALIYQISSVTAIPRSWNSIPSSVVGMSNQAQSPSNQS